MIAPVKYGVLAILWDQIQTTCTTYSKEEKPTVRGHHGRPLGEKASLACAEQLQVVPGGNVLQPIVAPRRPAGGSTDERHPGLVAERPELRLPVEQPGPVGPDVS